MEQTQCVWRDLDTNSRDQVKACDSLDGNIIFEYEATSREKE